MLLSQLIQLKKSNFPQGNLMGAVAGVVRTHFIFERKDQKLPMMHCSNKGLSAESSDTGTT
jgi:hypothetical protein